MVSRLDKELEKHSYTDNIQIIDITEERLMEIILSVKGVGKKRAEEIIAKIIDEGHYGTKA